MTWTSTDKTTCVRQHIPAKLEEIDRLCEEVGAWLDAADLGQMFFEVTLLMREALVNAVRHGSQGDEGKWIDVDLSLEGEELVIDVQDQGQGFDWKEKMHQHVSSKEEHGRGLMIFKSYANDVQYSQQGNRVTLRKTLAG